MYAQIVVHFKRDIDLSELFGGIPTRGTLDTAFAKSIYKSTPEVKASVAHWSSDNNFTITMIVATPQRIEGTVEISKDAIGLSTLKRRAESEFQSILDAAKNLGGTIDSATISIWAERREILKAERSNRWSTIKTQSLDKVVWPVLAALVIAAVSLAFQVPWSLTSGQISGAMLALCAAVVVQPARLIYEAFVAFKSEFIYVDA